MITSYYIDNIRVRLFENESIEVESAVANVNDITKNNTDFSRSITVPAEGNESIFKHYYNPNINGGFDGRIRVSSRIELDGLPFKEGKTAINKAELRNGKPFSYNLTFYGNLINLKDLFKDDELSDLPLSQFDVLYNYDNVRTALIQSLFNGDVIANLLTKKQLFYNSNANDNTNTPELANIAWGGGANVGVKWNELRFSLRVIKIIEAIETKYGVTFSRDFFGRSVFTELFLWLNNTSETKVKGASEVVSFDSGDFITPSNPTITVWDLQPIYYAFNLYVTPDTGFNAVDYTIKLYVNGAVVKSQNLSGYGVLSYNLNLRETTGTTPLYWEIEATEQFAYTSRFRQKIYPLLTSAGIVTNTYSSSSTIDNFFKVSDNIPKIKVIDFMKGFFNAFKLVIVPTGEKEFFVNPLKDYYAEGDLWNLTKYVDVNNYSIKKDKILNEINFGFKDPKTILNLEYEKTTGQYYGDEDVFIYKEDGSNELIDGEKLDFSIPFEQILYERLVDVKDGTKTSFQYGAVISEELKPVTPAPHVFYNLRNSIFAKPISLLDNDNNKVKIDTVNVPNYGQSLTNSYTSFLFSEEASPWDGNVFLGNLYKTYHKDYIKALFSIKRRTFNFKAKNIPLRIMLNLTLNDVIQIQDNYYRIDKYKYNLTKGEVSFDLINSFDNQLKGFFPDRNVIDVSYEAQTITVYVVNLEPYSFTKVDSGQGTNWYSVSNTGNNLEITFLENQIGTFKFSNLVVTNTETLQEFTLFITQFNDRVSIDNNVITIDNNIITIDSN